MSVWEDVVGQPEVVATLQRAVSDPAAMTHAWLLTGPPGSGRSTAARAFAAALLCPRGGCGQCRECRTVLEGSHADVELVATETVIIPVDQARDLVQIAQRSPSVGRYRVIVIEDADRLNESSGNALLKALEEPTPHTVWLLCAPSLEDVLITIRSRARHVRLRTPSTEAVAELLVRRDGIAPEMAAHAARAAQSHIGLARRLARDDGARIRRHDAIALSTRIRGVRDAVDAAADLVQIAEEERDAALAERHAEEKARLLEMLGADPTARSQPVAVRSQVSALEKEQKKRATRYLRDVVDRSLTDLMSVYRDALMVREDAHLPLVNEDARGTVTQIAQAFTAVQLLGCMDAIGTARARIEANVPPLLALEAMAVSLQMPR